MIFWLVCSIPNTVGPADSGTRRINYYEQRPVVSMVSIMVKGMGWSMWICAVLSERWFNAERHLRRFVSNVVKNGSKFRCSNGIRFGDAFHRLYHRSVFDGEQYDLRCFMHSQNFLTRAREPLKQAVSPGSRRCQVENQH